MEGSQPFIYRYAPRDTRTGSSTRNSEPMYLSPMIPVVEYRKGDILLSNIRPYLKKLWLADRDGGCNPDVLVIRVKDERINPEFLYNTLRRQQFFDYVMTDVKGMKMPRGNKDHILRYQIPFIDMEEQLSIIEEVHEYENIISEAIKIMQSCSQRKREVLQDYIG